MTRVEWKIPVNKKTRSIPHWCGARGPGDDPTGMYEWLSRDQEFDLSIGLKGYTRGRSAAYFTFHVVGELDRTVPFSLSMLVDMLKQTVMDNGVVHGKFGVVKQGKDYSMRYLGPTTKQEMEEDRLAQEYIDQSSPWERGEL